MTLERLEALAEELKSAIANEVNKLGINGRFWLTILTNSLLISFGQAYGLLTEEAAAELGRQCMKAIGDFRADDQSVINVKFICDRNGYRYYLTFCGAGDQQNARLAKIASEMLTQLLSGRE